eukprot:247096_1
MYRFPSTMILIIFFTINTITFALNRDWFFLDYEGGIPVRCGKSGYNIECASNNGVNCQWGVYGNGFSPYQNMSDVPVIQSSPRAVPCSEAWVPNDASNPCDVLGCDDEFRYYYLIHVLTSMPVRCNPTKSDELECASDDGQSCKLIYDATAYAYAPMINIVSRDPVSIVCPGWNEDACAKLGCYSHIISTTRTVNPATNNPTTSQTTGVTTNANPTTKNPTEQSYLPTTSNPSQVSTHVPTLNQTFGICCQCFDESNVKQILHVKIQFVLKDMLQVIRINQILNQIHIVVRIIGITRVLVKHK